MAFPVSDVTDRIQKTLYDETGVIWNIDEILSHFNNAVSDIVTDDPTAAVFNAPFTMVAGIKQRVPDEAIRIDDVPYNLDADENPGRSITMAGIDAIRAARPNWANSPPSPVIRNVAIDPRDPRVFYTWPPALEGGKIQIVYPYVPASVTATDDDFPLPSMYTEEVYAYVCWHCFERNDKYGNAQKADRFKAMYMGGLQSDEAAGQKTVTGKPDA